MADEKTNVNADFTFKGKAKGWKPFQPKGSDLLPYDGMTLGEITDIEAGASRNADGSIKNRTASFKVTSTTPNSLGLSIKKTLPVTGTRTDGKENIDGLWEFIGQILSYLEIEDATVEGGKRHPTEEEIIGEIEELDDVELSIAALKERFVGKKVALTHVASFYTSVDQKTGQTKSGWSSNADRGVSYTEYEKALNRNKDEQHPYGDTQRAFPPEIAQKIAAWRAKESGKPEEKASGVGSAVRSALTGGSTGAPTGNAGGSNGAASPPPVENAAPRKSRLL